MKKFLRQSVVALSVVGCGGALAADLPSMKAAPDAPVAQDWIVTLSGQVYGAPQYPGASRYGVFGAPGVDIRRVGTPERFSTPDDGFGVALYDTDLLRVGPVGRFVGDRSIANHRQLLGLNYVEPSLELGGYAEVSPLSWARGRLEVRQAVTGHDGLVATLGGDVWQRFGQLTASIGPRVNFGNDRFANAYFTVTPAESAVNGILPAYQARGGLTSAGGLAALRYDFNETWRTTGFVGYQRLTGSVAGSPIVQFDGSRNQYVFGVEVAYRFRTAAWFGF